MDRDLVEARVAGRKLPAAQDGLGGGFVQPRATGGTDRAGAPHESVLADLELDAHDAAFPAAEAFVGVLRPGLASGHLGAVQHDGPGRHGAGGATGRRRDGGDGRRAHAHGRHGRQVRQAEVGLFRALQRDQRFGDVPLERLALSANFRTVEPLIEAMERLGTDSDLRVRMGAAGSTRAKAFSVHDVVEHTVRVYSALLTERIPAPSAEVVT